MGNHYTYSVVVMVSGEVENVRAYPVLGIHTSKEKAKKHFELVLNHHRPVPGFKLWWDKTDYSNISTRTEMRRAYFQEKSCYADKMLTIELIIERRKPL